VGRVRPHREGRGAAPEGAAPRLGTEPDDPSHLDRAVRREHDAPTSRSRRMFRAGEGARRPGPATPAGTAAARDSWPRISRCYTRWVASRQVNIRLAELDRARLDRLAADRGLTRSELVRALLATPMDHRRRHWDLRLGSRRLIYWPRRLEAEAWSRWWRWSGRYGSEASRPCLRRIKTDHVRLEELTPDELRAAG
jgi:Ribbon-helix-helix protein, copG family